MPAIRISLILWCREGSPHDRKDRRKSESPGSKRARFPEICPFRLLCRCQNGEFGRPVHLPHSEPGGVRGASNSGSGPGARWIARLDDLQSPHAG